MLRDERLVEGPVPSIRRRNFTMLNKLKGTPRSVSAAIAATGADSLMIVVDTSIVQLALIRIKAVFHADMSPLSGGSSTDMRFFCQPVAERVSAGRSPRPSAYSQPVWSLSVPLRAPVVWPRFFWGSMAYTLIGGTADGTVLTFVFLPALYSIWFGVRPTAVESDEA